MGLDDKTPDRCFAMMMVMWGAVHHVRCAEIADIGLSVLDRWPDETYRLWSDAASTTALALRESGKHEESLALARRALAQAHNGMFATVSVHRTLALHMRMDQPDAAVDHASKAIEAAEQMGLAPFARELRVFMAEFLGSLDRVDEGIAITTAVIEETQPTDVNHSWALVVKGMLELMVDPDTAETTLLLAYQRSVAAKYLFGIGSSQRLLAIRFMTLHDYAKAAEYLLCAIEHNQRTANHGEQGVALLTATVLLQAAGHADAHRVAAGSQGENARPLLGGRELDDLLIPAGREGPSLPTNEALTIARAALNELIAPESVQAPTVPAAPARAENTSGAVLRRLGDNWLATFGGRTTSLRHTKGLDDIARMVALPGREIHVFDLVGAGVIERAADDTIDAEAILQYRDRVRDLQEELAEANGNADFGRAERAREELSALIDQLSSAAGLGGRVRKTSGTAERARSTVTKRVRGEIRRLLSTHPELGRHFDISVSTGQYCKYQPEHPVDWQL